MSAKKAYLFGIAILLALGMVLIVTSPKAYSPSPSQLDTAAAAEGRLLKALHPGSALLFTAMVATAITLSAESRFDRRQTRKH